MFYSSRAILILIFLSCCSVPLWAQPKHPDPFTSLNFYRLTNEEGLSQVSVNTLFKDSEGFLWVGTDDGLNRFDGKDVTKYYYRFDDPNTLAANEVYGICEDKTGRLWFAHYNSGISIFDKKTNRFTRLEDGPGKLSTNRVYSLHCDKEGFVVARTVEGISKIDPKTLQVRNFDHDAFRDLANTVHINIIEQGNHYWFGSKTKGLLRIDKQGRRAPFPNWDTTQMGKSVFGLCTTSNNTILAVSEKGLFRLQKNTSEYQVEPVIFDPILFASASRVMHYGNTPYVWVATDEQGFFIVDLDQRKIIRHHKSELIKDNLLSNVVLSLLQDAERNVYIGTARGVNIYSPYNNLFNNYENMFRKIPGFGHPVYAIHEQKDGNLLLGTRHGGAYFFNVSTSELKPIDIQESSADDKNIIIYHFTPFKEQELLVSTGKGIFILNAKAAPLKMVRPRQFKELDSLAHLRITDIHFQNDSIAWIASFTDGLFKWNYKKHTLKKYKKNSQCPEQGPVDDQIQKLVAAKDGNLIVCTKYGFSIFNPIYGLFDNFLPGKRYPYELPGRNIKDAYDDGKAIWVTTYGAGIERFDKKGRYFTSYTTKEGLPNDAIYSIIPDDLGRFWIGTNNGLALLNPKTGEVRAYTTQDGLPDNEFNGHAAYRSASGKIFFSTLNGIVSVSPFLENKNPFKPPVVLTYLSAGNGKEDSIYNTHAKQSFSIPAGYNALDLKFAALSFAAPKKNRYKVKLQGYDHNWLNLGNNNEIHYANLPPGNYVLKVQASNNTNTWNEKELQIAILILPFWYQTMLFKVGLSLVFVALIFMLIKLYFEGRLRRQRQEYEKMLAVQEERQRISAEIHDDIGAGLSAVRLLAEITKRKLPDSEVQQEVNKIHASIGELTGKMREVIWSLNTDNDHLENLLYYIQRQAYQLFENSPINLKVSIPTYGIPDIMISGEKRRHIYLSVKEALHNCLKHSEAFNCTLNISISENMLHISIVDDGKGFNTSLKHNLGNGMPGMKKRMLKVNGQFLMQAKEKTEVQFIIPLNGKL